MKITLTADDGQEHDVTEAVQIIFDALTASMDYGSGFLDYEDIAAIKHLATAGGFEQPEYQTKFCEACHDDLGMHRQYGYDAEGKVILNYHPCRSRRLIKAADQGHSALWGICGCDTPTSEVLDSQPHLEEDPP